MNYIKNQKRSDVPFVIKLLILQETSMDFSFTKEQLMFKKEIIRFAKKKSFRACRNMI